MFIKLEQARETVQKLNKHIGTTVISSSDSASEEDVPAVLKEAEQEDFEFAKGFTYITNVIIYLLSILI